MTPMHLCKFAHGRPKRHSGRDRISPPLTLSDPKGDPARTAPHPPAGKPISRRSPPAAYSFTAAHPFSHRRYRRYSCRSRRLAIKHRSALGWAREGLMRILAAPLVLRSLVVVVAIGCTGALGDAARAQTLKAIK